MLTAEQQARVVIDQLLTAAGWVVQDGQTKRESDQYVSPLNNYQFGEEFIIQHLTSNQLDKTARACVYTIRRMYSMLKGRELPENEEEHSTAGVEGLFRQVEPINFNPALQIETFDIIVTDEAHSSIPQAVAASVNVNYDFYRVRTEVTDSGSPIEAGYWLQVLDKPTRARRAWRLDDDAGCAPEELARSKRTPDQRRNIARTLRDRWPTGLFPRREALPRTLFPPASAPPGQLRNITNAARVVEILREELRKGNEHTRRAKRLSKECSSGRI